MYPEHLCKNIENKNSSIGILEIKGKGKCILNIDGYNHVSPPPKKVTLLQSCIEMPVSP